MFLVQCNVGLFEVSIGDFAQVPQPGEPRPEWSRNSFQWIPEVGKQLKDQPQSQQAGDQ